MALANGTTVKLSGLPADHPALGNGGLATVQGSSAYLGLTYYYCHALIGGAVHQIPAANVATAVSPNPALPLPPLAAFWGRPSHHTDAP